ncbi:MAG: hypothetical protein Q9M44_06940 [Ghiorsea sp.]|nr:hypothetical protein [Ghiorsea sp.]
MIKYILPLAFLLAACSESIEPIKLEKSERTAKPYEQNAIDAAGVAEGKEQVSPNGRPAY